MAAMRASEHDPREQERVEERLFALRGAARKYDVPVDGLPVLAFAPPFTLMRVPALFRILLALGLSGLMAASLPGLMPPPAQAGPLIAAAARELLLGATIVLAFQAAFGALYLAGRTVDIQAGFGLAALVDPTSRTQTPMVG